MRLPIWITLMAAALALGAVLIVGSLLLRPPQPLITHAEFSVDRLTPNADGADDVALFTYGLSKNAAISLTLTSETGDSYAFRQDERRVPDDYQVLFSGVVDGYDVAGETISGEVLRRLMPDGTYAWRLAAVADDGETAEATGTLVVAEGDVPLPELENFTVSPQTFTPNQDGIADRVQINVILAKDAELAVYLLGEDGTQYFIPERQEEIMAGKAGRHSYDYEGGVDQNADPPPDGTYTVVAEAQDAVGQRVRQTAELTIADGGKPFAQLVQQPSGADVVFVQRTWDEAYEGGEPIAQPDEPGDLNLMAITMPVGDLLVFKLTVENYSRVPIRTTGPEPGYVYTEFDQRASTIGQFESSGAWRVGIDCENADSDYPWRWAIGTYDQLEQAYDPLTENTYYYLPPGERSIVWGAIRMTDLVEVSNPQGCWAGLIHEDVQVANSRVGEREVELVQVEGSGD